MKLRMKAMGLSVVAAAVLAACGGGGGSNNENNTASTLSGVVVDGLIEGASVCLDLNVSLSCDAGEPTATTKADGSYALSLAGLSTAQVRGAHVLTTIPTTAKDADDGGKTLAQAGKSAFNLMAPAEAFVSADGKTISSAIVSPLTTLVSHEMMSGSGKSADAAAMAVVANIGLPTGTDLKQNFVGKSDDASATLQKRARQIAGALGELKKVSATAASGSDSERDRAAQLGALDYLKTNVKALVAAADAANTSATTAAAQFAAVKLALSTTAPAPVAATLVTNAQTFANSSATMDAVASDWAKVIDEGFYNAYCYYTGTPSTATSGSSSASASTSTAVPTCDQWGHYKIYGNGVGKWISEQFQLTDAKWVAWTPNPTSTSYLLTAKGWVSLSGQQTGTYTADGTDGVLVAGDTDGMSSRLRLTIKDVSGKKVSELIGADARSDMGQMAYYLPASFKDTVLPANSKQYVFKSGDNTDQYLYWTKQASVSNCSVGPCTETLLTSFGDLIAAYPTTGGENGERLSPWHQYWPSATFDAGGTDTGGTMSVWKLENGAPTKQSETAKYEIRTVFGEKVLVILPPASVVNARTTPTDEQMYTVRNGKLYQGSYKSAAHRNSESGGINWNPVAMKALLAAANLPTVAK